jgi:tetratricopeptide (TPR) repeat protein
MGKTSKAPLSRRQLLSSMITAPLVLKAATDKSVEREIIETNEVGADLVEEARFCEEDGDYKRGAEFARAALKQNLPNGLRADCIEILQSCIEGMKESAWKVQEHQRQVRENSTDDVKLWFFAIALFEASDLEASTAAYKRALEQTRSATMPAICLNGIGWNHYRNGQYKEALEWFQRASQCPVQSDPEIPVENLILTNIKLGRINEVRQLVTEYVEKFGRLPRYETWVLRKINIDADAIYLSAGIASTQSA